MHIITRDSSLKLSQTIWSLGDGGLRKPQMLMARIDPSPDDVLSAARFRGNTFLAINIFVLLLSRLPVTCSGLKT